MPDLKHKLKEDFSSYKEKFLARKSVSLALKRGDLIKPDQCELCASDDELQAHHVDYSKPLKIYWLCRPCHSIAHSKYSLLNPENQCRGPVTSSDQKCHATIATSVPFDMFVLIKKIAEENNTTISAVLRTALITQYQIDDSQTDFLRDDYERQEKVSYSLPERIPSVVVDENRMLQQELCRIQKLRTEGSQYLPGMEELFQAVC